MAVALLSARSSCSLDYTNYLNIREPDDGCVGLCVCVRWDWCLWMPDEIGLHQTLCPYPRTSYADIGTVRRLHEILSRRIPA